MQEIAVTGASGYLGGILCRRLEATGTKVRAIDLRPDPILPASIEFHACDVRDEAELTRALAGVDTVFHAAAAVPLTKAGADFADVNFRGSAAAAKAARTVGAEYFIHFSSSAIFGLSGGIAISPEARPAPIEIYGESKRLAETAVEAALAGGKTKLLILRPRTLLGHGRYGIFEILFRWLEAGRSVYTLGRGDQPFQFLHSDDLIDFALLARERGVSGKFNLGTDRYGTVRELLEALAKFAGTGANVRALPARPAIVALRMLDTLGLSPLAPWHYLTYHRGFAFDIASARALGWKPRYSNDEMAIESFERYRQTPADARACSPHRSAVADRALALLRAIS